ncbi:MAG: DUF1080 domain-containing protein [Planctomycetes bacterium]|nr:DUF1080 domain-containing protein [Planctomycetota bacterium]
MIGEPAMDAKALLVGVGLCVAVCVVASAAPGGDGGAPPREYHVSVRGDDAGDGSASRPLETISAAARLARPGDVITVHEGVYRERVSPPRGGESNAKRITYRAAPGETVVVKGSEIVKGWQKVRGDTWKVAIPNRFFGAFNPFADGIRGDWFNPKGRVHHTGAVYLNGHWLAEAAKQEDVLEPAGDTPLWFGRVDEAATTIWAQFRGVDPNQAEVEINVRRAVFYPEKPGVNYIAVRGFTMMHAATPWAPPTAEQIGLIGTHWSKGWIIEGNDIRYSTCVGIALGKHGDRWDNTSQNTAEGYVKTIERGLENGWSKERIGSHVVRGNRISHCEQAGIVGSLGAAFSTITGNVIHDIHVRQLFSGAEMAGIKIHAAIDVRIAGNHIYRTCRGIWLDWMAQGTRVTGNLLHDNESSEDLFVEVDHGPFLVDNNIFLSGRSLLDMSQGGAYAHNLFAGTVRLRPELNRQTPFHKAHSTEVAGLKNIPGGDDRFLNNLLVQPAALAPYDKAAYPVSMAGNVFLKGAQPCEEEKDPLVLPAFDPGIRLVEGPDGVLLEIALDEAWAESRKRQLVTTERLGKAKIPDLPYEQPDGSPYRLDADYFGGKRNAGNPFPGPFEISESGKRTLEVWPTASQASGEEAAKEERWIPLFNGKNLDGWKIKIKGFDLGENHLDTFRVEDGVMKVCYDKYKTFDGKFGHIFYKESFSNYRLRVEYRFVGEQTPGGAGWAFRNSGIMIHGQTPESMRKDQDFPVSIEVQLLGGSGTGTRTTANLCTPGTHVVMNGELITRHCNDSRSKTYHGDQWVTVEVEVHGNGRIRHIIDGETVLEYEKPQLDEGDGDARALAEARGGEKMLSEGTISLQAESHPVEFRKVEILPLDE